MKYVINNSLSFQSTRQFIRLGNTLSFILLTALFMTVAMVAMTTVTAHAKKVYSPKAEENELELEYQGDLDRDAVTTGRDGRQKHQFEVSYGVSDDFKMAVYGIFNASPDQSFAYSGVKLEGIYRLTNPKTAVLDAGLYLEYLQPKGSHFEGQRVEFKVLLEKNIGPVKNTLNIVFKKYNAQAMNAIQYGYAWRTKWYFMAAFKAGFEAYGDVGAFNNSHSFAAQSHAVGPVVYGDVGDAFEYEIGYLVGVTDGAADGKVKLNLEFKL